MTVDRKTSISRLGFLTLGSFDQNDAAKGLNEGIELFVQAEEAGFDSGWVRTRHLQFGISSPTAFLSAVSQRTSRIHLGTAVMPVGFENPFRIAEDLATVDLLSGGRLYPGLSIHEPNDYELLADALYGESKDHQDFTYARIQKLRDFIAGGHVADMPDKKGFETYSQRIQPHSPGLADRLFYGGGSLRSATWAGENGLGLLVSNITTGEGTDDFAEAQTNQINAYRAAHPLGDAAQVVQGRVLLPTDTATAAQKEKYARFVEERTPRTLTPQGPRRTLIAKDFLGTSEEIAEALRKDTSFQAADEVILELPFVFEAEDYSQILRDSANALGPLLGWKPAGN